MCVCRTHTHRHACYVKDVIRLADERYKIVTVTCIKKKEEKKRRNKHKHSGRTLPSACAMHLACPSNQSYLLLPALLVLMLQSLLFACPTNIHHHSVEDGLVDASACAFLSSNRSRLPELGHAFKLAATTSIH